jgi:hypothetical protein
MIYVPTSSTAPLETFQKKILDAMGVFENVEFTGRITPDFLDTEVKAFMRSVQFRIPKQIIL